MIFAVLGHSEILPHISRIGIFNLLSQIWLLHNHYQPLSFVMLFVHSFGFRTAIDNRRLEVKLDLTSTGAGCLKVLDDFHASIITDLAKDDMLAVKP